MGISRRRKTPRYRNREIMDTYVIDWESYFDKEYSLTKLSTEGYVNDPRFEAICIAVKKNNDPTQVYSGSHKEISKWLGQFDFESGMGIAHSGIFDYTILTWKFNRSFKLLGCTLSMARALHGTEVGGSLKALAEHYGIGEKGTEIYNAIGKRRLRFTEPELEAYMMYCKNDVDLTYELFKRLAPHFNRTQIKLIDLTLRMHTEPRLLLDKMLLTQHLHNVQTKKEELMAKIVTDKSELMSNPMFAKALEMRGVEPPMKTSARTGKETYAFAKSDEGMKVLLEHENPEVQALVAARIGVKSTLEETRTQRFIEMAKRFGKLPVPLKYYGAITGRWAATDGTNLQNIPRGSVIKEAIVAPEGWKIVGADLSNVELRVGLYFAGQMDKLNLLATGTDLYKDFASSVFGVSYDDVDEEQRFIGKQSSLSLIYCVGPGKLRAAIKSLSGKDIGEVEAKRIVDIYRRDYALVKKAWYEGDKALQAVFNNSAFTFGDVVKLPVLGSAGIKLPSELFLQYPNLKQTINEDGRKQWTYAQRKERVYTHGGKCYQQTIQALATCIMGEAAVRISKKLPIALLIHDAVYCVVPDELVDRAAEFIVEELKRPPEWAPDLPLDAEVGAAQSLAFKMAKLEKFRV
jgi:DNA polymerase I-like protein with 3'-5' exonuclease and polymerase domains